MKKLLLLFLLFLPLSSYSQEIEIKIKEKTIEIKYFIYESKYWILEKINDNTYLITKGEYDYLLNITEEEIILTNIQLNKKQVLYGNNSTTITNESTEEKIKREEHNYS